MVSLGANYLNLPDETGTKEEGWLLKAINDSTTSESVESEEENSTPNEAAEETPPQQGTLFD